MAKNFMNKVNIDEQDYLSEEQKKKAKEEEKRAAEKSEKETFEIVEKRIGARKNTSSGIRKPDEAPGIWAGKKSEAKKIIKELLNEHAKSIANAGGIENNSAGATGIKLAEKMNFAEYIKELRRKNEEEHSRITKENDFIGAKDLEYLIGPEPLRKRYVSPREFARQKISDSVAEKAGVSEDVFQKMERERRIIEARKDAEEGEWFKDFGKNFLEELEKSSDYITTKQARGKIVVPQKSYGSRKEWYQERPKEFLDSYNAAEDYVMSEGENAFENTVKGMFNNLRSTFGGTIEKGAFLLSDNIPNYKAAKKVYLENKAGEISEMGARQFELAKAHADTFGDRFIGVMDMLSKELGYEIFGSKMADWLRSADIGFTEYENLRKKGIPKEEAFLKSAQKAAFSFAEDKFLGNGGNWLKKTTKGNIYGFTANSDEFVDNFNWENYNGANKQGELVNEFYDLLTDQEWAQYYQKIAERGKLNSPIGDIYVWDGNGIIVISKRVRVTGNTNDYQVIDFDFTKNSYEAAQEIQKEIDKNGGRYNARKIAEIIDSFGQ